MKRKYPRETFASRIIRIKELMPDCCIAADVIVGFPGETAEDFEETYSFIEGLPVSYIHVFSYSERPGTPAVKLPEKVPGNIIKDRSRRLHKLSDLKKQQFYLENKHRKSKVLFESDPHKDHLFGFTENYIKVKTPFDRKYINKIVTLTLEKQDNNGVYVYSY